MNKLGQLLSKNAKISDLLILMLNYGCYFTLNYMNFQVKVIPS